MTTTMMMKTQEMAKGLIECLKKNDTNKAYDTYFSKDVINEELVPGADGQKETRGLEACKAKSKEWLEMMEINSQEISEPLVTEGHIAIKNHKTVTNRKTNQKATMEEICLYTVHGGKIIRESFFYSTDVEKAMQSK